MASKSKDAFRTISEVATWLDVPAHVLRFWESKFPQVKPVKRAGGRRYYRPSDMMLIGGIKSMLHDQGLTIRGVQKKLKEDGIEAVSALSPPVDGPMPVDKTAPVAASNIIEATSIPPEEIVEEAPFIEAPEEPMPVGANVVSMSPAEPEQVVEDIQADDTHADDAPATPPAIETIPSPDLDAIAIDPTGQAILEARNRLRRTDLAELKSRDNIAFLEHKARSLRDRMVASQGDAND